ncbi:uncharacterized protein LOC128181448 isoform X1 [Crassostrea angulata]|uniref:uncharacterized protein LOC128181448 isoform X1 n=1 Tax=Magallana angulata TaxID=2784310 RepID=UPI0022B14B52|nr:uncharacterized protein LOC128181448 isoform X1 [Crassostrea angulata]
MDISSKALIHYNEKLRREYEIVCLFVGKIDFLNTRTGEVTSRSRRAEHLCLPRVASSDGGNYSVKKSLSDGIIETGSCTQIIKAKGHQLADVKDDHHNFDINNNQQHREQSEGSTKKWSLIQTGSSNEDEDDTERTCRELELEARAARQKQIEDFFTDPVDREIFPLNPPETPTTRIYRPIEIPTAEESISIMLAKFSAAFRDKDFMREVYEYRRLPRPPARGLAPLSYEWLTLNTYFGLMQSTEQQDPGDPQVNANIQQSLDTEIETKDDQGIRESDSYFSVEEDEENKFGTNWFVRVFCCGANSISKKERRGDGEKSKGFLSRLRRFFGKK